jgi:transposase
MALATSRRPRDLTDEQWEILGPFLPVPSRRKDGRGRPWEENRTVLNGILWILRTGAPWADLPDRYPSYQTCHRRFQQWVQSGVLKDILSVVAEALHDEGCLDLREAFIDGSFAPAKKGGTCVGKTKCGKGTKIMAIADRHGLPVAVLVESATPHEVTLVNATADAGAEETGAPRWGRGLRVRSTRRRTGTAWHRADRSSPKRPQTQDAGWPTPASIPAALEGGTTIRVASKLPTDRRALRTSLGELSRDATPCLLPHPAAVFMR